MPFLFKCNQIKSNPSDFISEGFFDPNKASLGDISMIMDKYVELRIYLFRLLVIFIKSTSISRKIDGISINHYLNCLQFLAIVNMEVKIALVPRQ